VWIVQKLPAFEHFRIIKDRFHLDIKQLRENLSIAVPIGLAMFMEASIFGVVALFIAKFGTVIIAEHQAAL
ncbi:MATE family efflux transporter, partial [Phascolarctobacterium faecium]|nr:MATE family efflux transporter [Phascolarctobacterium faecium]